jgi:hypothetical protein
MNLHLLANTNPYRKNAAPWAFSQPAYGMGEIKAAERPLWMARV